MELSFKFIAFNTSIPIATGIMCIGILTENYVVFSFGLGISIVGNILGFLHLRDLWKK